MSECYCDPRVDIVKAISEWNHHAKYKHKKWICDHIYEAYVILIRMIQLSNKYFEHYPKDRCIHDINKFIDDVQTCKYLTGIKCAFFIKGRSLDKCKYKYKCNRERE